MLSLRLSEIPVPMGSVILCSQIGRISPEQSPSHACCVLRVSSEHPWLQTSHLRLYEGDCRQEERQRANATSRGLNTYTRCDVNRDVIKTLFFSNIFMTSSMLVEQ